VIIAVDGPAASGKGTIARAIALRYELPHLDTGLLYRAVAHSVMAGTSDPHSESDALLGCNFDDDLLDDPMLRTEAVGRMASVISAHAAVRLALRQRQRDFANRPGGAVLDGRDIGTVIAPDATVKLFITASADVRAHRRYRELITAGMDVDFDEILLAIRDRDVRDMGRAASPLKPAVDALLIDTTDLDRESSIGAAVCAIEKLAVRR